MNRPFLSSPRRVSLALWVLVSWLSLSATVAAEAFAQTCTQQADSYSREKYKVRAVYIKSPFGLVARALAWLKPDLPLQPGSDFSLDDSSKGRKLIEDRLKETEQHVDARTRIKVILAEIGNCDESDKHLDVTYWVVTTDYNSYLSHTWEFKNDESTRPADSTAKAAHAAGRTRNLLSVNPYADYNRTRQLFLGTQVRMRMPGGVFESLDADASGSPAGNVASLELVGVRTPQRTALNRLEYRLGYHHEDLPADNNRLRRDIGQLQFSGATKPLGDRKLVVRFGTAVEGGKQRTALTPEAGSLADSSYGALKTYIGATLRSESYALAASYGVQVATHGATMGVEFVKPVFDLALTARWLPKHQKPGDVHRALTLDAQLSGGTIRTRGRLPVPERFFGGNAAQYFVSGDSWRIRSGPFIRSIPQNSLGGAVGGTSFYSFNLTLARPVWGYPMIPKEMAADPEFPDQWEGAQNIARSALMGTYLSKFPEIFREIIAHLAPVKSATEELRTFVKSLPEGPPDGLPSDRRGQYQRTLTHVKDVVARLNFTLKDEEKAALPNKLESLLKEENSATCMGPPLQPPKEDEEDDPSLEQITCSLLTWLRFELVELAVLLRQANLTTEADRADSGRVALAARHAELVTEFDHIDKSGAKRLADVDMKAVTPILKSIKDETNLLAISPVAIFDVARIWPDRAGTRFGLGGGVRLTLVNFNLTFGYAFNPDPRPGEARGAFFFSMDVSNLFR